MNLSTLKCRDELGSFLNVNGLVGEGLEVGVLSGDNARQIMSQWNGKMLHLLDPWETQPDDVYQEPVNHCDWNSAYQSCVALAKQYEGRINLIKGYSPKSAALFQNGQLDWCYIDANHSLEAARDDIFFWSVKVKDGGLFGGHDYRQEFSASQNCDVKTAVDEFARAIGKEPHVTRYPGCYSWWFIKS